MYSTLHTNVLEIFISHKNHTYGARVLAWMSNHEEKSGFTCIMELRIYPRYYRYFSQVWLYKTMYVIMM